MLLKLPDRHDFDLQNLNFMGSLTVRVFKYWRQVVHLLSIKQSKSIYSHLPPFNLNKIKSINCLCSITKSTIS